MESSALNFPRSAFSAQPNSSVNHQCRIKFIEASDSHRIGSILRFAALLSTSILLATFGALYNPLASSTRRSNNHNSMVISLSRRSGAPSGKDASQTNANLPSFRIEAWNAQSRKNGQPGAGYRFLSQASLIEPHAETELILLNVPETYATKVHWTVKRIGTGDIITTAITSSPRLTLTLKCLGNFEVTARMGDIEYTQTFFGRYVRREIRAMSDDARNRYLDAVLVMTTLTAAEGRARYGDAFRTTNELMRIHLNLAGDRDADRLHSGLGFLMQHVALSNAYELALRTIDPSVALPYWDFTLDYAIVNSGGEGLVSDYWKLDMWRDDWFGNATISPYHTPIKGRFAYQVVDKDWNSTIRNPYGYLRSPWNMNKNKFVTRVHKLGGVTGKAMEWPDCQSHFDITFSYDSVYDYMWDIENAPHGAVHVMIGGYLRTGDVFDELDGVIPDTAIGEAMQYLYAIVKGLWRNMPHATDSSVHFNYPTYCSDDTPQTECHMICPHGWNDTDGNFYEKFVASYESKWPWLANITEHWATFAKWLCNTPFAPGEHLESASPVDPSFWPIHPTLDRLLVYKRLVQPFKHAEFYNENGETTRYCEYSDTSDCMGHHPWDITAFGVNTDDTGRGDFMVKFPTVGELFNASSPDDYRLDYVYENFNWHHCDQNYVYFPRPPGW